MKTQIVTSRSVYENIAQKYGTPTYVYNIQQLHANLDNFQTNLSKEALVAVALKANSNLSLLRILAKRGFGADVVSGGELFCALQAGIDVSSIIFSGVGKTQEEIEFAVKSNIYSINIESSHELEMVVRCAKKLGSMVRVSFRVNPNILVNTHPNIATGGKDHKFGMSENEILAHCQRLAGITEIRVAGLHAHIGSQIFEQDQFVTLLDYLIQTEKTMTQKLNYALEFLNFGGGYGIDNMGHHPNWLGNWLHLAETKCRENGVQLVIEPGRSIFANMGVLLSRVLGVKRSGQTNFLIIDAGMNDFMRTALYDAEHPVSVVAESLSKHQTYQIVGPVCETTDVFAKEKLLPDNIKEGDLLLLENVGAYGFSMASQYNRRCRPAEIAVEHNKINLIRRRETFSDLVALEQCPK
ncbi:MAG: diaminopimelate decarboxylase [Bdellovibrionales bacterium]|nr:diaminopimelate decarboxylase [Bdellovibrionales bacterium]